MQIIIPLSGIGKRFINANYKNPKPLILINNKPMIEYVINLFPNEDNFIFICNDKHLEETNIKNILESIKPNCKIYSVSVNNRKGPVDAVIQIKDYINDDDEIIVSYCDYNTEWDYNDFKNKIKDFDGGIACYKGFHPHSLGTDNYAYVKEENNVMIEIQEKKPFTDNKMNEYASNGTYYFKSGKILKKYFQELIDQDISINNEYYVSMVYNLMKKDNHKILIYEINKMIQWGTPKDLEEYLIWSNYFLNRKLNFVNFDNMIEDMILILPMAGNGSRFYNEGYDIPKPLLLVENKPMIIKALECLPKTNKQYIICQNKHLNDYDIKNTLINNYPNSEIIGIDYVTNGQACTCDIVFEKYNINLNNPLMISACDNGLYYDINKFYDLYNSNDVDIIIFSFSNNITSKLYPNMYAWLDVDSNNYIKRVSIKKPFIDCENKYAIIGTMIFKKSEYFKIGLDYIYKHNIKTNDEYYVDNLIEPLINMGYKCKIFNVDNYLCWGTPNDYKTYNYWFEYFNKLYLCK